ETTNGCESSRTSVAITINPTPAAPTVAAQTFCSSDNTTVATLPQGSGSYKWYSASTGGNALDGSTTLNNGTYYVSQTTNGCESSRASVAVSFDTTDPEITADASDSSVESDGNGNAAALNAWLESNGGATATDANGVTWSNDFDALSDLCGATGSATV